jgi:hypothetical protein
MHRTGRQVLVEPTSLLGRYRDLEAEHALLAAHHETAPIARPRYCATAGEGLHPCSASRLHCRGRAADEPDGSAGASTGEVRFARRLRRPDRGDGQPCGLSCVSPKNSLPGWTETADVDVKHESSGRPGVGQPRAPAHASTDRCRGARHISNLNLMFRDHG